MKRAKKTEIYGLMAEFDSAEDLLRAARKTSEAGYKETDAFSPYPVEGLHEALEMHTRLPWLVLAGGVIGAVGGFALQYWVSVMEYPLNVGGRPLNSWPAFIPVTFETTVLVAGLTAVVGMFALNGLPRPYHPVFNIPNFEKATDNKFFLAIEETDPQFDREKTRAFLETLNPVHVYLVEA